MYGRFQLGLIAGLVFMVADAHAAPPPLASLFADPEYRRFTVSPDGQYFGVIVPVEGRDTLVTLKGDKSAVVGRFSFRDSNESVGQYQWLKNDYLLIQPTTAYGWNDVPSWHGELFAARADGKNFRSVFGYRAGEQQLGSRMKRAESTRGSGYLLSDLPDHEEDILISAYPWVATGGSQATVQRINLRSATSKRVLGAPAPDARFIASPSGEVRFASALDRNEVEQVFEFMPDMFEWKQIASNSIKSGSAMEPVGMSADGRTVYYLSDANASTKGLFTFDMVDRQHKLIYRHETDNVDRVQLDPWTGELLWVTLAAENKVQILNTEHRLAKVMRMVLKSFEGQHVSFTSVTRDYKKAVFHVESDRDPGVWYSLDTETRKANLELIANTKIDPEAMVPMQHIEVKARDGLKLHGYFTAKKPADGSKPPMVVLVHGGPHARDSWGFNPEVQALATRGYAVLQINFRGSTGYGREFEHAGRGQWGRAMQDDVTDATRWAIDQGLVDGERVCIMGGSYGGYASLMGLVREPDLYKCGIDMYGVTDLELLFKEGDVPDYLFGKAYIKGTIGADKKEWDIRSPAKLADKIKAPVLILAGGKDERVPVSHSEKMEEALKAAGKPIEALYFENEGHGFYKLEHRVQAYQKVLDFLAANIGKGES